MAKKEKKHIIKHQIINLEINGVEDASEITQIQQNILYFYKSKMAVELEKIFDKIAPKDAVIELDKLDINLDDVNFNKPADLEREITQKFKVAAEKQIKAKLKQMQSQAASEAGKKQAFSKTAILEFFLKNGHYPSWASTENGTINEIFDDLMERRGKDTAMRIFRLGKDEKVQERLYQQFSKEELEVLLEYLYGNNAAKALEQIQVIQKRLGKKSEKAVLSSAINQILSAGITADNLEFNEREFTRNIIAGVQKRNITSDAKTKVKAGFQGTYQDFQILEYFLEHGAIPNWAEVDSKKSLQDLFETMLEQQLVQLQRMMERHISDSTFMQRLIFQFTTDSVLKLLLPTPEENIQFIQDSLEGLEFLNTERQNIGKTVSKNQLRTTVLTEALDYFFLHKRTNFVKKNFIKALLEDLAKQSKTDYQVLVKESYKYVRRKKSDASVRFTLEQLDEQLQEKLADERKELRTAQQDYRKIERELEKLQKKQEQGTLTTGEMEQLKKMSKDLAQLEQTIEELEDIDMPLDIELLLTQRQELKQQLLASQEAERAKLQNRLDFTEKEFQQLQNTLGKEIDNLLKDKAKLKEQGGSIAEKRIKRLNNRLGKYHRSVKGVLDQLSLDEKDLTNFLGDINKALRGDISSEERSDLRKERTKLQEKLQAINAYLEELKEKEKELAESLKSAMATVEGTEEPDSVSNTSKLDALVFMLQYGATPWWAEQFPKQSIEELFLEFAANSPQKLRSAFQQVGKYPIVWERAVHQLSEKGIKTVLSALYPTDAKTIFAQADLLFTIHYSQGFPHLNSIDRKRFQWANILEYLLGNSQGFNEQQFNKEITLQTARLYNISPSKLIEYNNNIIKNRKGDLIPFEEWNNTLAKDPKVAELDRELMAFQRQQELKEQGLLLTDTQKLELLTEFLASGKISDKAKTYKYDSLETFEDLLLEQIQKNKAAAKYVVSNLLRLSNARALIIKELSEETFWEIVHLVRPKALLPVKRYFSDFEKIFDKNLHFEKDVLLNLFISQQQENFDAIEYVKALLVAQQQATGRKAILLIADWKRQIRNISPKSSWMLSMQVLEIEALKMEQQQQTDTNLRKNLQIQLESAAKEYSEMTKELVDVLSSETAEALGIMEKDYKLSELDSLLTQLSGELEGLKKNLLNADVLKAIEIKRKINQQEAQIKLLSQRRPPLLRKLEKEIAKLMSDLEKVDKQLLEDQKKNITLENTKKEEAFQLSLLERQHDMLDLIKNQAVSALKDLLRLLEDSTDDEQSNYLFFKDLEQIAKNIPDTEYRSQVLDILEKANIEALELNELKRSTAIDERQEKLLQNIDKTAPTLLWKEFDELEDFYKNNPNLYSTEKDQIQKEIKKQIKRREHKNWLAYLQMLRAAQVKLEKELEKADDLETLAKLQAALDLLWQQQQNLVDNMLEVARDERMKIQLKQLRQNIDHTFTALQNRRMRLSNSLKDEQGEALRQKKLEQALKLEELKQKRAFTIDEIQKEEKPKAEEELLEKLSKRKKQAPKPKPVEEPLKVFNAGLVLIWPYIGRLFTMLKYVEGKSFVSIEAQYKAIHLLQYLATGKTEAPENELLLNKVMCNFPISEPVPFGIEFTPEELKMADGLLQGVINNWPKMKTMSPGALRGSFLIREGTIIEEMDKWVLKVQKKPYDILLKTLPWGFTFMKLPWSEKFISVEWPLF